MVCMHTQSIVLITCLPIFETSHGIRLQMRWAFLYHGICVVVNNAFPITPALYHKTLIMVLTKAMKAMKAVKEKANVENVGVLGLGTFWGS